MNHQPKRTDSNESLVSKHRFSSSDCKQPAENSEDFLLAYSAAAKKTTNADANENSQTRAYLHRKPMKKWTQNVLFRFHSFNNVTCIALKTLWTAKMNYTACFLQNHMKESCLKYKIPHLLASPCNNLFLLFKNNSWYSSQSQCSGIVTLDHLILINSVWYYDSSDISFRDNKNASCIML